MTKWLRLKEAEEYINIGFSSEHLPPRLLRGTGLLPYPLLKDYPPERITEKIELYDYLKSTDSHLLGRNPAGYLRKAIEEDYTPPEGFTTTAQREEQKRKDQEEKQQQEVHRKEREYQQWLETPDEEKIKGDLWIWDHRFKKEHKRNPSPEEIETKRRDLILNLPSPEEKRKQIFRDG